MKEKVKLGPISHLWWMPLLVGFVAIGLGVWALCDPGNSLPVLGYVFAGLLCLAGVLEIAYSCLMSKFNVQWGWPLVIGILDIVAGVWLYAMPEAQMTECFMLIIGIWLLCVAIDSIAEACVMASYSPAWMILMILLLLATIVCVFIVLTSPVTALITIWLCIGISLICFGVYRVAIAIVVRSVGRGSDGLI